MLSLIKRCKKPLQLHTQNILPSLVAVKLKLYFLISGVARLAESQLVFKKQRIRGAESRLSKNALESETILKPLTRPISRSTTVAQTHRQAPTSLHQALKVH